MCSACMTSSPRGSNRAVEQSCRSVMFGECADRIRTAPISSQAARSAPVITWRATGSRFCLGSPMSGLYLSRDRARLVDGRSPARRQHQRRLRQFEYARPVGGEASFGLALKHSGLNPIPVEASLALALGRLPVAGCPRLRLRTRLDRSHPDGHQLELAMRVAIAVAGLVLSREVLREASGIRLGRPRDRELEGLAAVAELVDDLELCTLHAGEQRLAERPHLGHHALGGDLLRREEHGAGGVAAVAGGDQPERREDAAGPRADEAGGLHAPRRRGGAVPRRGPGATSPSAEGPPRAGGQTGGVTPSPPASGGASTAPAPPKGSSAYPLGSTPRSTVTTRSARIISWLATRTIPSAV